MSCHIRHCVIAARLIPFIYMENPPHGEVDQSQPPSDLRQLNEFVASQGFAAEAYVPGRYASVHHLFELGADREDIARLTGRSIESLDDLEATIAAALWNRLPEDLRRSDAAAALFKSRLTEEEWLAGIDQSWLRKGNVSPRKLRLRHMDAQLRENNIEPRELLIDDTFCATVYPYMVAGLNMGRTKLVSNATYDVQDELINRLETAAPHVFGLASKQPEPPTPADPNGQWRSRERRLLLPLIDRRLAATRTDPAALLGPRALAVYRAMVGTDVIPEHYAQQHGQSHSTPTVTIHSIIDRVIERVPAETLQLHRLRRASALALLGISYEELPIEYTEGLFDDRRPSTLHTLGNRLAHVVTADTPWLSGEMQLVIRSMPAAFEAAGRQPEEVLPPGLMTLYRACVELEPRPGTLIRHLNRDKRSINGSMKSILRRVAAALSEETLDLANRRRQARAQILQNKADVSTQAIEKNGDT